MRYPYLLAAVAVLWLCRRWLPDPYLYFKHAGHVRRLRAEIAHNADNVTARRDLAKIWLTKKRPRRAIVLLEEARRRDRESAELPFLLGKALFLAGRAEESLPLLVEAAQKSERQMYGEAYLVAGKALRSLGRFAEAEDAFARLSSASHRAAAWIAQGDLATRRGEERRAAVLYRRAAEALQDFRF